MGSISRHRWSSRRHHGDISWRGIQGARGIGRTTNMDEGCMAVGNVTVRTSGVSLSFPHHLRVTSGVGETKTHNLLLENALMKQ